MRWDLDHAADIGPITHVENATPRHPAVLVGGGEATMGARRPDEHTSVRSALATAPRGKPASRDRQPARRPRRAAVRVSETRGRIGKPVIRGVKLAIS
jgi:hypothetical protein